MGVREDLQKAQSAGHFVSLRLEDDTAHDGFVLNLGSDLVLLQEIYEWQDAGALIVPIHRVTACEVSDYAEDQLKILDFNSVRPTKRYGWMRINSLQDVFKSLKFKEKFVVLSAGDDTAEVGLVDTVEDDCVVIKAVDPDGNWLPDEVEWPYEDISLIQFDDSYSRVLQRYVAREAALN